MSKKYVICYYDNKTSTFYTGTGGNSGFETVDHGVSIIHESKPLNNYPMNKSTIDHFAPKGGYKYAKIEERYYPEG